MLRFLKVFNTIGTLFLIGVCFWIFIILSLDHISDIFFGYGGILPFLTAVVFVLGINFTFWGLIGIIRLVTEKANDFRSKRLQDVLEENQIKEKDVAVVVPAHNEELVIAKTMISLLRIVKPENLFVVSDASSDRTADIASSFGANVLRLNSSQGKAGALDICISNFKITKRFKAVIFVDADTRLRHDYLIKALPFFNDPEVVAVAGYAATIWNPEKLSWKQLLFISHRDRVYFLFQMIIKFGQTWKYANVTHIVPGFASIYRASILDSININPPGLVIEDFNMTFEVHRKKLGKIAHHPSVVGYTQDPDNMRDYFRQVKRWHLGFWQTIRLHGFWVSKFWANMIITLIESVWGSFVFLLLPIFIVISFLLSNSLIPTLPKFLQLNYLLVAFLIGIWFSDYILTVITALFQKRKEYLYIGLLFPFVRLLDAVAFLYAIPRAFWVKSNGRWESPSRR